MKSLKVFSVIAAMGLIAAGALGAQSNPRFRLELVSPLGYDWARLYPSVPLTIPLGLDALRSGGTSSMCAIMALGPFEWGIGLIYGFDYMTDLTPAANHGLFDHATMVSGLTARAEWALLPWMRPYVQASASVYEVWIFNAIHIFDGSDEYAAGGEASIGICFIPYRKESARDSFSVILSPRGMARWIFLQGVGYGSIDAGADFGVRYETR